MVFVHFAYSPLFIVIVVVNSVLRERFKSMEEIHRKHNIQLDSLTQDDDDLTQATTTSRMSFGTSFTTSTSNTHAITREDMDAFQRALDAKNADLNYEFDNAKKQHRLEEDAIQREILELQAKLATINNGEPLVFFIVAMAISFMCIYLFEL